MILLDNRSVISVTGKDAAHFLQGLITQDIKKAAEDKYIYSHMLTPQGKFLFDFIILKTADGFLLDTLASRAEALVKRLSMYKLRSDVTIKDVSSEYKVYHDLTNGYPDPRKAEVGMRLITDQTQTTSGSFADYEKHRIELGLPESEDFIPEDDFPMQANLESLHGVDFSKGCYVGQEVTARTKYKGAIKYAFYKVAADTPITKDGKTIRAVSGNNAIAHLPVTEAQVIEYQGKSLQISKV